MPTRIDTRLESLERRARNGSHDNPADVAGMCLLVLQFVSCSSSGMGAVTEYLVNLLADSPSGVAMVSSRLPSPWQECFDDLWGILEVQTIEDGQAIMAKHGLQMTDEDLIYICSLDA